MLVLLLTRTERHRGAPTGTPHVAENLLKAEPTSIPSGNPCSSAPAAVSHQAALGSTTARFQPPQWGLDICSCFLPSSLMGTALLSEEECKEQGSSKQSSLHLPRMSGSLPAQNLEHLHSFRKFNPFPLNLAMHFPAQGKCFSSVPEHSGRYPSHTHL